MDEPRTHSIYGGLWIDRDDWEATLAQRRRKGQVGDDMAALVRQFVRDGYCILPGAAAPAAIDAFQRRIDQGFRAGNPDLLYQQHGSPVTKRLLEPVDRLGTRVVDSYVALPEALELFTAPRLHAFLAEIFAAPPLLFQSLSFDQGSQQGLHQDTAYVVVDRPLELAACWIALQDVEPGSGELIYVPGSHRLPDWPFGGGKKHWDRESDGDAVHTAWSISLVEFGKTAPQGVQRFLPRKGDILIWHADLAHGGAPVENTALRRQSLVGHFCPNTCRPHYFDHGPRRQTRAEYRGLHYASEHYDLAERRPPAAEMPPPPADPSPPACVFGRLWQRLATGLGTRP